MGTTAINALNLACLSYIIMQSMVAMFVHKLKPSDPSEGGADVKAQLGVQLFFTRCAPPLLGGLCRHCLVNVFRGYTGASIINAPAYQGFFKRSHVETWTD